MNGCRLVCKMLERGWVLRASFLADKIDGAWQAVIQRFGAMDVGYAAQGHRGSPLVCKFDQAPDEVQFLRDVNEICEEDGVSFGSASDAIVALSAIQLRYEILEKLADNDQVLWYRLASDVATYGEEGAPNHRTFQAYSPGARDVLQQFHEGDVAEIVNESIHEIRKATRAYEMKYGIGGEADVERVAKPSSGLSL
jgi:hypothetical protein